MGFLIYFALLIIIPLWAQMKVKSAYKKYSKVPASSGMTGAQVARKILDDNGLYDVRVEEVRGTLTDHYDPRDQTVRLSSQNFHGTSVAGAAVAAHEVGHAIQDAHDYAFLRFRHALVPVANFGSNFSFILIIAGILMQASGLLLLGIVFMAAAVLFQLVTLPVEFDASNRAMSQIVSAGVIRNDEERETRKVLNAAALTYVAGALVALLELARFILMYIGMNDD
ncbi:zinc metallopeptidase [Halalkalibacterium halodurans]|jgi:Zn-dependent membrane protease YugP|uniref:BH1677 protein n=2 Tax=Halalkalibacterium halodurans TaxID=86665 RepID=Q9KC96_HALH5|nr:zinc metallopeptidase [Halalkalibacterium halodurans]MDY7222248.1 zinc metallopeptidase [Halalkalibacterium halodurans]MDY7241469.1 zinc metallopeptidase [Halalkalibacterium halodurans]MED3646069.1 zinc metallopeptidase [Halalkalibacterium halodurans]MED4162391.1 zinc metallopeptidase [Halalkalibacterium halodurans]MED4173116.1 zinc metallopeptidase [Halalkalibacterium halodurans]